MVQVTGLWTRDPNFDLSYHVRRVSLPPPGSVQQVLEIAQTQAVTPLDRSRPPWVGLYVEGVEGGRSAYILQCHHVLMDGGGATQLFGRIMGRRRESHPGPLPEWAEKRATFTPVQATSSGLSRVVKSIPGVAGKVGATLADATVNPLRAAKYARSAARVVAPQSDTLPDSVKTGARTAWRFGTLECELTDLKKAGVRVGMVFSVVAVAALIGSPIAGVLIQADNGQYLYAQMFMGCAIIAGSLTLTAARVAKLESSSSKRSKIPGAGH